MSFSFFLGQNIVPRKKLHIVMGGILWLKHNTFKLIIPRFNKKNEYTHPTIQQWYEDIMRIEFCQHILAMCFGAPVQYQQIDTVP